MVSAQDSKENATDEELNGGMSVSRCDVLDRSIAWQTDTSKSNKNNTNAYPTYSKGLAHVKSRELLKRLIVIVYCKSTERELTNAHY